MSGSGDWRVIVTESRAPGLSAGAGTCYVSPAQSEPQARALIALLAGTHALGAGPWRRAVAGGQRTVRLEHQP